MRHIFISKYLVLINIELKEYEKSIYIIEKSSDPNQEKVPESEYDYVGIRKQ